MSLDWLVDIGKGSAGGLVVLAGQVVLHHFSKGDVRRGRAEQRSEDAAREVLQALTEARERCKGDIDPESLPHIDDKVEDLVQRLDEASLDILDDEARRRVEMIGVALSHMFTLASMGEGFPAQVTRVLLLEGRGTLGALRRGQPIPSDSKDLERYRAVIQEDWDQHEESMRRGRERRAAERRAKAKER